MRKFFVVLIVLVIINFKFAYSANIKLSDFNKTIFRLQLKEYACKSICPAISFKNIEKSNQDLSILQKNIYRKISQSDLYMTEYVSFLKDNSNLAPLFISFNKLFCDKLKYDYLQKGLNISLFEEISKKPVKIVKYSISYNDFLMFKNSINYENDEILKARNDEETPAQKEFVSIVEELQLIQDMDSLTTHGPSVIKRSEELICGLDSSLPKRAGEQLLRILSYVTLAIKYQMPISDINIDNNVEAQNVVVNYIFNLYPNIKVADYKFFCQMFIYPLLNVQKRYVDIFDMAINLKRESFDELSLQSQIPLLYNLIGETVIKCPNESKYFDGAIESYDLLVTVIQKNSSKSPAISQEEAQGLLLNIYYNGYTTLYEKYQKYEDAVKSLDYVINNTDENHWMHSEAITKKNKFLELINNKPIAIEFDGPLLEPFYVNLSNDELYNGTLILKNAAINSPDIVIELSFNKIFEEDEQSLIKYCNDEAISFRRYKDENDNDKSNKIGFLGNDKYVDKIEIKLNSNNPSANFKFSPTNYCGDIFEIIATEKSSQKILGTKRIQIWRKYIFKTYTMKDHNFIPDMTAAKVIYEKLCVKIIDQKCEIEIPYYDYITFSNSTNTEIECNAVLYYDKLKGNGLEFNEKKDLKFINIIGINKLIDENSYNCGGYSARFLITKERPFYSIFVATGYFSDNPELSINKTIVHEIGHCFNLIHELHDFENCYMKSGEIKSPEFCKRCKIVIKNSPIFSGEVWRKIN